MNARMVPNAAALIRPASLVVLAASLLATSACATRRLVRPATSKEQASLDQRQCYDLSQEQYASGTIQNPDGTMVGAAAAGVASGVSEVVTKFRIEMRCLEERGYALAQVTPEQAKIIDGGPSQARERVVLALLQKPAQSR